MISWTSSTFADKKHAGSNKVLGDVTGRVKDACAENGSVSGFQVGDSRRSNGSQGADASRVNNSRNTLAASMILQTRACKLFRKVAHYTQVSSR